jgi:hypothetical protein
MKRFRFSLSGNVGLCFSIEAENEQEAGKAAREFLLSLSEGVDMPTDDSAMDARVYIDRIPSAKKLVREIVDAEEIKEVTA